MAKKIKKIAVGWAMMRLNKAGNWKACEIGTDRTDAIEMYNTFQQYNYGDYEKGRRAGTLKVKKMWVTM